MLRDAMYYKTEGNNKLRCLLCPHNCLINPGESGICSVRTNKDGVLKTINYGQITAMALDPVRKKPLYHFYPDKNILSVGSFGCNFDCDFCQNYSIAQSQRESQYLAPAELIQRCKAADNNIGIAFTYNEPSIWYEYIYDVAKKLKKQGSEFKVVLVTNGFIEPEPLKALLPYIDAMNIDLKAFSDEYYNKVCKGSLDPVLATIKLASKHCHVEVTTLLVTGLNDSKEEVANIASFIADIDKDIPLHLSRYFPNYKMDLPPTDVNVMKEAELTARKYLNNVHLGNV